MSNSQNKFAFILLNCVAIISPLLIHALSYFEIATVPTRVDGRAVNPLALSIYGFSILITILLYLRYARALIHDKEPLIITLLPLLLSLVFAFSLFMPNWLGEASYLFRHALDTEIVAFVSISIALTLATLCVVNVDMRGLLIAALLHIVIYFGMYGIPHFIAFPQYVERLFGPRLYIPVWTAGIYVIGFMLIQFFSAGWRAQNRLLTKCVVYALNAVTLLYLWNFFPDNGQHFYGGRTAPEQTWTLLRPTILLQAQLFIPFIIVFSIHKFFLTHADVIKEPFQQAWSE